MNTLANPAAPPPPRLRLMGIADMLDVAILVYKRHFFQLTLITAGLLAPLSIIETLLRVVLVLPMATSLQGAAYSQVATLSQVAALGQVLNVLLTLVSAVIIYGTMMPALVWAAGQYCMDRPATFRAAYSVAVRRLPAMAACLCVYLAVSLILLVGWVLPCCITWLGMPAVWIFTSVNILTLLTPVLVLENGGVIRSIQRTWLLTRRTFWRALGLMVALYLFSAAVTSGPAVLTMVLVLMLSDEVAIATVVSAAIGVMLTTLYMPVWGVSLALCYYDARVRCEALDLQWLAGLEVRPETALPRPMPWFESSDWSTLGILTGLTWLPVIAMGGVLTFLWMVSAVLEAR